MRETFLLALLVPLALTTPRSVPAAGGEPTLHGTVVAARTREPIASARVVLDSLSVRHSSADGSFDFGSLDAGEHVLVFEHVAYVRRVFHFRWPELEMPLVIELEAAQFEVAPIHVTAARKMPSLPVSAVSFDRDATTTTPGNIANDPLRTVQSHPSAASAGIDFLSTMTIRGGNTEELRVYFDDFPLRHYAHVGGFSSVVYDDMLASTVLVPGAAPLRYHGALSGIVVFEPDEPDTSTLSGRYDITSMAGGGTKVVNPSLKLQAAAKSSFFNLPIYQQVGIDERSFQDFLGRVIWSPRDSLTLTPTLLLAKDSETGTPLSGVAQEWKTWSALGGVELVQRRSEWALTLRSFYSYYRSLGTLTWQQNPREHRLQEAHVYAEASRQGPVLGFGVLGEAGTIRHDGYGGTVTDTPFSAAAELRLLYRDTAALVLGAGPTREEWTKEAEPEAYASLRVGVGGRLSLSGALRRAHQSPILFSERRYFASIPVDPGDLLLNVAPGEDVRAVRMDQTSVQARLDLPLRAYLEGNAYWRRYDGLLTWDWSDFPVPGNVENGGSGHGDGYEIMLARIDPRLSLAVALSSARVQRREGTLTEEVVGDFDKPDALQAGGTVRVGKDVWISVRWTDTAGRPYTPYDHQTTPPTAEQINSVRLGRFQRLDFKFTFDVSNEDFHATVFVDLINMLDRHNVAATYALEVSPGEFTTAPYGGTGFFPIGGVTIRF